MTDEIYLIPTSLRVVYGRFSAPAKAPSSQSDGDGNAGAPSQPPPEINADNGNLTTKKAKRAERRIAERKAKQEQRIWDSFRLTLYAILKYDAKVGIALDNQKGRQTVMAIEMIRRWLRDSVDQCGLRWTITSIKEYTEFCRCRALRGQRQGNAMVFDGCVPPRNFPTRHFERGSIRDALGSYQVPVTCDVACRTALAQMARIGRAQPEADAAKVIEALEQHRTVLTTDPPVLDDNLRGYLQTWAYRWASSRKHLLKESVDVSISRSASVCVSEARGGQLEELTQLARDKFDKFRADAIATAEAERQEMEMVLAAMDDPEERAAFEQDIAAFTLHAEKDDWFIDPEQYAGTYNQDTDLTYLAETAMEHCMDIVRRAEAISDDPTRAACTVKASAIAEIGYKARVVTASNVALVVGGTACRKAIWAALEAETRADLVGERDMTDEDPAVLHASDLVMHNLRGSPDAIIYSADLKAATDYLPFSVSECIIDGLADGFGIGQEHQWTRITKTIVCRPLNVEYDIDDRPPIVSVRGAMMGLPMSWTILNLYNLAISDLAVVPRTITDPLEVADAAYGSSAAVIRGDDQIASFTEAEADAYEQYIEVTGGVINRQKSYRAKDAFVLAERTFLVNWIDESDYRERITPVTRPRLAVSDLLRGGAVRREFTPTNNLRIDSLRMLLDIPIRHLMPKPARSFTGGRAIKREDVPVFVAVPEAVGEILYPLIASPYYRPLCRGVLAVNAESVRKLSESSIPLFVDRLIGGGGFAHPDGYAAGMRSGGRDWHVRATLMLSTHGSTARSKLKLDTDLFSSGVSNYEMASARRNVSEASDRLLDAIHKRSMREAEMLYGGDDGVVAAQRAPGGGATLATHVQVSLEDAAMPIATQGILWREAFLKGDRSKPRTIAPKLIRARVANVMKPIRGNTRYDGEFRKFLCAIDSRREYSEMLHNIRHSERVYVPYEVSRDGPLNVRLSVVSPIDGVATGSQDVGHIDRSAHTPGTSRESVDDIIDALHGEHYGGRY